MIDRRPLSGIKSAPSLAPPTSGPAHRRLLQRVLIGYDGGGGRRESGSAVDVSRPRSALWAGRLTNGVGESERGPWAATALKLLLACLVERAPARGGGRGAGARAEKLVGWSSGAGCTQGPPGSEVGRVGRGLSPKQVQE